MKLSYRIQTSKFDGANLYVRYDKTTGAPFYLYSDCQKPMLSYGLINRLKGIKGIDSKEAARISEYRYAGKYDHTKLTYFKCVHCHKVCIDDVGLRYCPYCNEFIDEKEELV